MTDIVMELNVRTRQQGDEFMETLLDDLETGQPTFNMAYVLMVLHVNHLSNEVRENIESKSTYIFTTHEDKNDHNCKQMSKCCNE